MKLDNISHCHKDIRMLCFQLETLTGLKCVTNLSEEFEEIRFTNSLSYIVIDFKRDAVYTMSYKLEKKEWETVKDILIDTTWLYVGHNYKKIAMERERSAKRAKARSNKKKKSSKKN